MNYDIVAITIILYFKEKIKGDRNDRDKNRSPLFDKRIKCVVNPYYFWLVYHKY
uniref:Uncharacterized protein n=1 Tax=Myoviridae sp. ctIty1 TaxID=2827673 RepID=A0A8S5TGP5_9CAUD|nr:MAG TPA: hypothetical protein [Myoviridae sp. ctIty1]